MSNINENEVWGSISDNQNNLLVLKTSLSEKRKELSDNRKIITLILNEIESARIDNNPLPDEVSKWEQIANLRTENDTLISSIRNLRTVIRNTENIINNNIENLKDNALENTLIPPPLENTLKIPNLIVSSIANVNGLLNVNGNSNMSGNLNVSNKTDINDISVNNLDVSNNLNVSNKFNLGNKILLDNSNNIIIKTNIIPDVSNVYTLGSLEKPFMDLFSSSLYVNGTKVISADLTNEMKIETSINQNLNLQTSGMMKLQSQADMNLNTTGINSDININTLGGIKINSGLGIVFDTNKSINYLDNKIVLSGDVVIDGSLNINGNNTVINTESLNIKDNIVILNSNQTSNPEVGFQSGFEVVRGNRPSYHFKFRDLGTNGGVFEVGEDNYLQPVATRKESQFMTDKGILYWDNSNNRLDTFDNIKFNNNNINFINNSKLLISGVDILDNLQTQINSKQATITGGATTITGSNLTASRALVSDGSGKVAVSAVTSTELGYVSGVTSAIQTQINGKANSSHTHSISNITDLQTSLDAKQATITGGATTITGSNLTASRALVSDGSGKVAVSAVTSTQLGYVSGVTSAIQTQINGKANTSHNHDAGNITSGTINGARMPMTYGGIGTYAFLYFNPGYTGNALVTAGSTVAGSSLSPAGVTGHGTEDTTIVTRNNSLVLSGTWRLMGNILMFWPWVVPVSLFVRIS